MSWNNLEVGMRWMRVISMETGKYPDVKVVTVPISCRHCADPKCIKACPEDAINKRLEDGIVLVDRSKCTGCRQCLSACPFGAPQFGEDGLLQMCNFCLDRTEKGLDPVCMEACPMRALYAGTTEELSRIASGRAAKKLAGTIDRSFLM